MMEPNRYCFKKGYRDRWYLILQSKATLFSKLLQIDDYERFADEFDDQRIKDLEDYSFEFPLIIDYEE